MITHLGDIALHDARALDSLGFKFGANYATHELAMGKPIKQRVGQQADEWQLGIVLNQHFCSPEKVLGQLRTLAKEAQPVPLIFGNLDYQGWVLVGDIEVTFTETDPAGRIIGLSATVPVTEYTGPKMQQSFTPGIRPVGQAASVQAVRANSADIQGDQPFVELANALIAEHRLRALLRRLGVSINPALYPLASSALGIVHRFLTRSSIAESPLGILGDVIAQLSNMPADPDDALAAVRNMGDSLASTRPFFARLATQLIARQP